MIWLRRRLAGRVRIALHPAQECRALLAGSGPGAQRPGLLIWAAAIDEAARGGVASGWQSEPGLVIGVLPHESPAVAGAFGQQALRLIAPQGEPHASYQIGRLTRWPRLWAAVGPQQRRWGRAARARAGGLTGVGLINLDWVQGCLSAAARRRGAQVLADRWESAGADQVAVALTEGDGPVASAFRPVEEWLDALCAGGATKEILDLGLQACLSGLGRGGRNRAPRP